MRTNIEVRQEMQKDDRQVEELIREAFWNHYVPGCNEHYLAHQLRASDDLIKELDLVAVVDDKIVGSIMYTRAKIACDNGDTIAATCFGPLAVHPKYQGKGIGNKLIEESKKIVQSLGYRFIIICGDPQYYSRFGFVAAETFDIAMPGNMYAEALQVLDLTEDGMPPLHGIFLESKAFDIDSQAAEDFDRTFPTKEKVNGVGAQERFAYLLTQIKERNI